MVIFLQHIQLRPSIYEAILKQYNICKKRSRYIIGGIIISGQYVSTRSTVQVMYQQREAGNFPHKENCQLFVA